MQPVKRVALVTGASRGIGFAIAKQLYQNGWNVAITSRFLERAEEAAETIRKVNTRSDGSLLSVVYSAPLNCTQDAASEAAMLIKYVNKELGPVSTLVNAAGVSKDSLLLRLPTEDLHELTMTNLIGPILMSKAVTRTMMQQGGSIITIGSVVGSSGNTGQVAYSASKSGLIGMTRSLAKELASRKIRVNLVEPGFIETDMTAAMTEATKQNVLAKVPLSRLGTAEEVGRLVSFLASDDASYITGQCIRIDGGLIL